MEVLLVGNTGYITKEFIAGAFPECHVYVLGAPLLKSDKSRHITSKPFPEDESMLREMFEAYEFERVVYFSNFLTFHGRKKGELEQLRKVIQFCAQDKNAQVIYLTGPEGSYSIHTGKTVLAESAEHLCMHYCEVKGLQLKILRIPYLYSAVYEEDYFYRLFSHMEKDAGAVLPESPKQNAFFLSMKDLEELLFRVFEKWTDKREILNVPDCFGITFLQFGKSLEELKNGTSVTFSDTAPVQQVPENDKVLRYGYGWFPKISVLGELPELYEQFQRIKKSSNTLIEKIGGLLRGHAAIRHVLELIAGFLLVELLVGLTDSQVQFRMIDMRLLFVVLMGTIYGMNIGIAAAAIESLSLILAYSGQGVNWLTLFYEPSNWVPFIAYFTVGAICGYIRMKSRDNIQFVKRENELIQEKFFFMRKLYEDVQEDKQNYKRQIIGSRDSFGKIYDITRQLDVVRPQELYLKTVQVMENILENHTIAIYSLGKKKDFARLEVCSGNCQDLFARSICTKDYDIAFEKLEQGNVWANTDMLEGYPIYMVGVRKNAELVMIIVIREADYTQMTLYYQNLLKILCGLVETSLLRMLDYQEAARMEQYVDDTSIMKEKYFLERLGLYHSMREQKMAEYVLLQIDLRGKTLEEADRILAMKIRNNDILGLSNEGYLYLILAQTGAEHVPVIMDRLKAGGFYCKEVDQLTMDPI